MHWICKNNVQGAAVAFGFFFAPLEQIAKLYGFALELGENLQAVVVIAHILLVNN